MSLAFCLAVAVIAAVIRMAVGMIASCIGALDGVIIRGMDALMAIPGVLLAIAVASLSGATLAAVIVALVIAEIPRTLQRVPLVVLTMREPPSVVAALAAGMRLPLVRPHHLMPNTVAPKIDQATGICCSAMPAATIREFPGPGIPPEIPFGSNRMAAGWAGLRIITWIIVCPGIALAVLAVDTVGDQLLHPLDPQLATKVRARSPAPPRPPSSAA